MSWTVSRRTILVACGAIAVFALATVVYLGRLADRRHDEETLLARSLIGLHELDGLEWRAIAAGRVAPDVRRDFAAARARMFGFLDELSRLLPRSQELRAIRPLARDYVARVESEFRMLETGDVKRARAFDARRVDPAFEAVHARLRAFQLDQGRRARTAMEHSHRTSLATLVLAGLGVGFLLWRASIASRRAERAVLGQQSLRESEERFRSLVQNATEVIAVVDPAGRFRYLSPSIERVTGLAPGAVEGRDAIEFVRSLTHPDDRPGALEFLDRCARRAEPSSAEFRIRHRRGDWRVVEAVGFCRAAESPLGGIVLNLRDVTESRHAEEALVASEERYRLLFDLNPQPLWLYDVETLAFLDVNAAAVRHYGWSREEFLTMSLRDIRSPEDVPQLMAYLEQNRSSAGSVGAWRHRRKDGTTFEVEVMRQRFTLRGRHVGLALAADLTERNRLEAEFRQAQKMEAVGRLAGGVAHDFNNLMTAVLGYSQLLLASGEEDPERRKMLGEIEAAGQRAAAVTRRLLAFSRKQALQPTVLDLNAVVEGMTGLLRRVIGEDVQLVVRFDRDLGMVLADPGGIEQVLMNLAINARDAMAEGGTLTLSTANLDVPEAQSADGVTIEPGRYVALTVSDIGCGMSDEVRSHLFEPFFTTKEQGKGTGLGLATVYGIVRQSGGRIHVSSSPGRGTTFRVLLPRSEQRPAAAAPLLPRETLPGGTELILLVEDEDMVRGLARESLSRLGYRVLEASSGREARDLAERFSGPIDLLLTDIVMPHMSGRELAAWLKPRRPNLSVLYTSGYEEQAAMPVAASENGRVLQKPFTAEALARAVRETLDRR